MSKHTNTVSPCPACEDKLKDAHALIADWFRKKVKPAQNAAHISWSYRDQKNQDQCFVDGKSKLKFPMSAHNKSDDQGNPCSLALDLFELDYNGMACWAWKFFRDIADRAKKDGDQIKWGGDWKSLGDGDHFELIL